MNEKEWDYSKEEFVKGLRNIGISKGDTVFTYVGYAFLGRVK